MATDIIFSGLKVANFSSSLLCMPLNEEGGV
jgi:hypothetical protein